MSKTVSCAKGPVVRRDLRLVMCLSLCGSTLAMASHVCAQQTSDPEQTGTASSAPGTQPSQPAPHSAEAELVSTAEGDPLGLDLGYHPNVYPEPAARVRTLLAGTALMVGGYGLAFGSSYLWEGAPGMSDLRTPFVGPALAIANAGCGEAELGCNSVTIGIRSVLGVVAGIAQLGGLGLLIEGAVMSTASSEPAAAAQPQEPQLYAVPVAPDSGLGFSLGGTF